MKRFFLVGLVVAGLWAPVMAFGDDLVKVYAEQDGDDNFLVYADSQAIIPMFVSVEFVELTNMVVSPTSPVQTVLEPKTQKLLLATVKPKDPNKSTRLNYSYLYVKGDPSAKPDDTLYLFPFAHGTKARVGQGNNGSFSHYGENQYAFDFDLKEGTPVYAARDGLVAEVVQKFSRGGTTPEFESMANYVLVYQADGTFGNYVHLRLNGAAVKVGQTVKAGDLIGYSGNTGFSSGPHLHFDVRLPLADGHMTSIPIRFRQPDGTAILPQAGTYQYASVPGRPAFVIQLGSELTNADYAKYSKAVGPGKEPKFRDEELDDTIILFVQNTTDADMKIDYTLKLTNLTVSTPNPGSLVVPRRTEVFVGILQPIKGDAATSWGVRYSYLPSK